MAQETILIVEDETLVAMDLRLRLESMGYRVAGVAASGRAAFDLARDSRPDLILMDIMIEGDMDGIQTAMLIRQQLQIPVIYVTASSDAETLDRAMRTEPFGFIHKPLDPMELHSAIEIAVYKSRLDRKLRDSELRYRRLVESVTDYIFTVRVEHGRAVSTTHTPACVAVTGYSLEEYQADPDLWFKMVPEVDQGRVLEQARRLLAGQVVQPLEHRLVQKNGTLIWVRNTAVPHFDDAGRLVSYDGLVTNITERKRAEEQLKEHARKLAIINLVIGAVNRAETLASLLGPALEASLELMRFRCGGIYLLGVEASAATRVCWKSAAADGDACLEELPADAPPQRATFIEGKAFFGCPPPGGIPEVRTAWTAQAAARLPLISQERIIGSLVMADPAPHDFSGEEKSVLQSIGRQLGAAVAKLRSEAALRESEEKYRILSEQSLAGIQIIRAGRLTFVNAGWSKIVGYSREEALAWPRDGFDRLIHPDDRAFFVEQVRRKQAGISEGVVPVYDCRLIARDGATKWVLMHSQPVMFADGLAIVGVLVDITDRKLAEQALAEANRRLKAGEERLVAANLELSEANREKEVLLKEIHHRVKNNLQIVSSLLNLQLGHVRDTSACAVIRECQSRIKSIAIVHEKLYQSRNLAQIELGEYIRSLVSHLFRTFLVDPASIRMELAAEQVSLDVDQAIPCCLIINELVTNSLKYAFPDKPAGVIGISLQAEPPSGDAANGSQYALAVSDNGVGFPPGVDFRAASSMGMQLVMTFVEQLGGSIELDTRGGTTFTIRFASGRNGKCAPSAAARPAAS